MTDSLLIDIIIRYEKLSERFVEVSTELEQYKNKEVNNAN